MFLFVVGLEELAVLNGSGMPAHGIYTGGRGHELS